MKRLILVRHAKSSWKYNVSDLQRPLKKRGVLDSNLVSNYTNKLFFLPSLVLCSPSKRTIETASIFIKNWNLKNIPFKIEQKLYDFSGGNLIEAINNINISYKIVLLFTHNFAITEFVNKFGTININSIPTCGLVVIDFNTNNWKELVNGVTSYKVFPKEIKD